MGSSPGTQPNIESMEPEEGKEKEEEVFGYALQLVNGSAVPMTLHAAMELGIFEIISKAGPGSKLSPSEIAAELRTQNPGAPVMLDRVLRLLASHCVLTCSLVGSQRVYGLAPVAKYFVPSEDGVSFGPVMSLLQDKVFLDSWSELKNAILEGGVPFDRVHGTHAFEYPGRDPRFNQVFNNAMFNQATIVMKEILGSYKGFKHIKQLVDVGGGLGVTLNLITLKYPSVKGINFDLPHVIEHAPCYPGVEHVGGDMFQSVPKGDAIFMKLILHDWSDAHCLRLLKNCHNAIPDDGMVIVVEAALSVMPETSATGRSKSQADVVMMTQNPGGKERTREEFMALATGAGFRGIRFVCSLCNLWVMEFYK